MGIEDGDGSNNYQPNQILPELERRQKLFDSARRNQIEVEVAESRIADSSGKNLETDTGDLDGGLERTRREIRDASDKIKAIEDNPKVIDWLHGEANIIKEKIEGDGGLLDRVIKLNGDTGVIRKEYLRGLIYRIVDSDLDRNSFEDEESINGFFQELGGGLEDGTISRKGSKVHQMGQELRSLLGVGRYKNPDQLYVNYRGEKLSVNDQEGEKKYNIYTPEVVNYILAFADVLADDKEEAFGFRFRFMPSVQDGELGFKSNFTAPSDNQHLGSYYVPKEYTNAQLERCKGYYESSRKLASHIVSEYAKKEFDRLSDEKRKNIEQLDQKKKKLEEVQIWVVRWGEIKEKYGVESPWPDGMAEAVKIIKSQIDSLPVLPDKVSQKKPFFKRLFGSKETVEAGSSAPDSVRENLQSDLDFLQKNGDKFHDTQTLEIEIERIDASIKNDEPKLNKAQRMLNNSVLKSVE